MSIRVWLLTIMPLSLLFACESKKEFQYELTSWKFSIGDNLTWADPAFDDSQWATLSTGKLWEDQGFEGYDGYAWYRIAFHLPESTQKQGFFNDTVQFYLGRIDDSDEVYLNGVLVGKNGEMVVPDDDTDFTRTKVYSKERYYKFSISDLLLKWNDINTLAIRVHDYKGGGGMYYGTPNIHMRDIKNYLFAETSRLLELQPDSTYKGNFILRNTATFTNFTGKLTTRLVNTSTGEIEKIEETHLKLEPASEMKFEYQFPKISNERRVYEYTFVEERSQHSMVVLQESKYLLTPKPALAPRINGPKVTAARPGKPFLYLVPVTGKRPISYSANNLPEGLILDSETGIISGQVPYAGEYLVQISANNEKGKAERELKIVIGEKLCLTPPMGWNSWNCWGLSVDEEKMRSTVDHLIASGLVNHGWNYVNIDDGWETPARNSDGEITTNEKFGSIKNLSDYVHSKGLKIGIYSSPGEFTCGGYLGSYQHEKQDVKTFVEWKIDFLKYDWCSYRDVFPDNSPLEELQKPYFLMQQLLDEAPRDIIHSICQYGREKVWEWGEEVGAQLWRTTGDITDTWESMSKIGFIQTNAAKHAKPGHWNDPDMLVVGNVGWGPNLHPTRLTPSKQYTHISLWSLLAAPLLIGCDLATLDDFTLNLLTNDEVLAINQDVLGIQATPVIQNREIAIYTKLLENGSIALGLFNLTELDRTISIDWKTLGIRGTKTIRDVWRQTGLGQFKSKFDTLVPAHGVVLVKLD